MTMTFRVASGATLVLGAVVALIGMEPGTALAQEITNPSLQNVSMVPIVPAVIAPQVVVPPSLVPGVIVDQGLLDGTGDAPATPTSLSALVEDSDHLTDLDREHECLAGAVYFESKGEPLDGQLAVAQVIMNRAESGRFPTTACGVVFQRGQFSFVRGGGFPPINRQSRAWREAVAIAGVAMNDRWDSSVDNALFFHAARVSPGWRHNRIARVGNHVFYR